MRQFEKYRSKLLDDQNFQKEYINNCNVCVTVWQIVDKALGSGKSRAEISSETGISEEDLIRFAEGDNCQYEIVSILGKTFNIALPTKCNRYDFKNK